MTSPAFTSQPSCRLTPRYLGLLSRPLRLVPAPFLCAMANLQFESRWGCSAVDAGDFELGVHLPVPANLVEALAALALERPDLRSLAVGGDGHVHRRARQVRRAHFGGAVSADEEDILEVELAARGELL